MYAKCQKADYILNTRSVPLEIRRRRNLQFLLSNNSFEISKMHSMLQLQLYYINGYLWGHHCRPVLPSGTQQPAEGPYLH